MQLIDLLIEVINSCKLNIYEYPDVLIPSCCPPNGHYETVVVLQVYQGVLISPEEGNGALTLEKECTWSSG